MESIKVILKIGFALYFFLLIILYFVQEKLIFHPSIIPKDYAFQFEYPFEEINIEVETGIHLNNVLINAENSEGVVLIFHGNGGAIRGWAQGASLYLENNYDVMYTDYRGYGKSDGRITSEQQLIEDGQKIYDFLKSRYEEEQIIVSGISIGTGLATQLAARNSPQQLILQAPYYSLKSLIRQLLKIVPTFILKYPLDTAHYIESLSLPITIFHGKKDHLIPYQHAEKLSKLNTNVDLHLIEHYGHNDILNSPYYRKQMGAILK